MNNSIVAWRLQDTHFDQSLNVTSPKLHCMLDRPIQQLMRTSKGLGVPPLSHEPPGPVPSAAQPRVAERSQAHNMPAAGHLHWLSKCAKRDQEPRARSQQES